MKRLIEFLTGFIIGMSLGAAIGLLLAPQSGSETLTLVRGRVDEILEEGREAAEKTRADAYTRLAGLKEGQA